MQELHKSVPHFILKYLSDRRCSKCNTQIVKQDVIAIGIRTYQKKTCLYIEHQCKSCHYREITNYSGNKNSSVPELCYVLLEHHQKQKDTENIVKTRKKEKKSITDKEVNDLLRFMNDNSSYDDFMKYIGADKHLGDT